MLPRCIDIKRCMFFPLLGWIALAAKRVSGILESVHKECNMKEFRASSLVLYHDASWVNKIGTSHGHSSWKPFFVLL